MFIVLFILTILVYFVIKRRNAQYKYRVELSILAISVTLVLLYRVFTSIYMFSISGDSWDGSAALTIFLQILTGIYSTFGAFQFEGISDLSELTLGFEIAHYELSLYLGLLSLSMISFSLSYEFYSTVLLRRPFRSKTEYYIFTSLNENNLKVANSIATKLKSEKRKYMIVFAVSSSTIFERSDPLVTEAMLNNYLYVTVKKNKCKSLVEYLGVKLKRPSRLRNREIVDVSFPERIHVFAFNLDENLCANEKENSRIAFDEVRGLYSSFYSSENFYKNRYPLEAVSIHVLTHASNDFILYEFEKRAIISALFEKLDQSYATKYKLDSDLRRLNSLVQLNLVNEAELTARSFSVTRVKNLTEKKFELGTDLFLDLEQAGDDYHALFLGFGSTGEEVMKQLYMDTSYIINPKLKESRFCGTILDKEITDRAGIFRGTHPLMITVEHQNDMLFSNNARLMYSDPTSSIATEYNRIHSILLQTFPDEECLNEMTLPLIAFKNTSVTSSDVLNLLDANTGVVNSDIKQSVYSFSTIVIAIGDDVQNIALANVIISDARKEIRNSGGKLSTPQTIAVHIRNKENYFKLDRLMMGNPGIEHFHVFGFGMIDDVFSYDYILNHRSASRWATTYDYLWAHVDQIKNNGQNNAKFDKNIEMAGLLATTKSLIKTSKLSASNSGKTSIELLSEGFDAKQKTTNRTNPNAWLELLPDKKASNVYAVLYFPILETFLLSHDKSDISWFGALEHTRWNRFHIINGWSYGNREDMIKIHDALIDFNKVPNACNIYDTIPLIIAELDIDK